jgi:hypothetical protein
MLFDFKLPEPLRADVKAVRSLRKKQKDQEHTQSNNRHFGLSVPQIVRVHGDGAA